MNLRTSTAAKTDKILDAAPRLWSTEPVFLTHYQPLQLIRTHAKYTQVNVHL